MPPTISAARELFEGFIEPGRSEFTFSTTPSAAIGPQFGPRLKRSSSGSGLVGSNNIYSFSGSPYLTSRVGLVVCQESLKSVRRLLLQVLRAVPNTQNAVIDPSPFWSRAGLDIWRGQLGRSRGRLRYESHSLVTTVVRAGHISSARTLVSPSESERISDGPPERRKSSHIDSEQSQ